MAAGENMMDLALKITADPSQAVAAVDEFQQKIKSASETVAQSAQVSHASMKQQLADLGIQEDAWVKNAAAARQAMEQAKAAGYDAAAAEQRVAASMDAVAAAENNAATEGRNLYETAQNVGVQMGTMGEEAQAASGGIYESLAGMRRFRMIFAATIGIASFGFWINEWGRLVDYLGDALQKMEGIHTEQNDIVMSQAFQALKQIGQEEQKQLLQPHSARMARIYQEGIRIRLKTLERLHEEAAALQRGSLAGEAYAKALNDITANSRQFGLQGPLGSVAQSLEKQIEAYRAIVAVEQEYGEKHSKAAKVARDHALAAEKLANATAKLAQEEAGFQFQGKLFNFRIGDEFTSQQTGIMGALAAQRFADLKAGLAAYQSFEKAAANEEARSRAESARQEQQYFRQTEGAMRRHVQTVAALQKQMTTGGSFAGISFKAIGQTFAQFNAGLREASQLSGVAIEPITRLRFEMMKLRESADMVGLSFQSFTQDIGRNAAQAIVYGSNFGQTLEKATKATLAQIAAQSFIWGLFYTAHGIADVFWNPPRAVADFAAAGEFFGIGGASAAVGAAIPGGAGGAHAVATARGGSPAHGLSGSPGVAGGEGSPGVSPGGVHHNNYISILGGGVFTTHDLQNVVEAFNQGGQAGTIRLNIAGSSHTLPNPVY